MHRCRRSFNGQVVTGAGVIQSQGSAQLQAGNNINLNTVTKSDSVDATRDERNYTRFSQSQDVGSQLSATGNLNLVTSATSGVDPCQASKYSQRNRTAFWSLRMDFLTVGNPAIFAIESSISEAYKKISQRALGHFVFYLSGNIYGVRTPHATLLACSLEAIRSRLSRRGSHVVPFGSETNAKEIVNAYLASQYREAEEGTNFFGMGERELGELLVKKCIVLAPDGDAAFDDGSHILHIDHGNAVRLIAFKNVGSELEILNSVVDEMMDANQFYGVLDEWQTSFEVQWQSAVDEL